MKLENLSTPSQQGLRRWAKAVRQDERMLDATAPEQWAWVYMQLRLTADRPEWFPKGKWALLQAIENELLEEALDLVPEKARICK